jgi:hypothetical protein
MLYKVLLDFFQKFFYVLFELVFWNIKFISSQFQFPNSIYKSNSFSLLNIEYSNCGSLKVI